MKVKYVGESFYNGFGLTNGKTYECVGIDYADKTLSIIDDEEEESIYSIDNPSPADGSNSGGKWEIIDDPDGLLEEMGL